MKMCMLVGPESDRALMVLEAAVNGRAVAIVTFNQQLLIETNHAFNLTPERG
ncbi:MAG TPA: hypothetical protein VG498_24395 [Terriglobales bacterium]|nr:hypothetical protein [Terriglobales bacterium]